MEPTENIAINNMSDKGGDRVPESKNTAIKEANRRAATFTPADVAKAFNAEFLVESFCRYWVIEKLHQPKKFLCPECGAAVPENLLRSFWEAKRIECDKCGKWFTALTGTFLSGCHFDFREIVLFVLLIGLGVQDKEIARIMTISAENVRLWRIKFNERKTAEK